MKKHFWFYSLVAALLLVFLAGCMNPQTPQQSRVYSGIKVEKVEGGYAFVATQDLSAAEVDFTSKLPKDIFKSSFDSLLLHKYVDGKTVVAVASTKGIFEKGTTIFTVKANELGNFDVEIVPARRIKAEELNKIDWATYESTDTYKLLGDVTSKDGRKNAEVDLRDFLEFVKSFFSDTPDPRFDFTRPGVPLDSASYVYVEKDGKMAIVATEDLKNGEVDLGDFAVFAYNFGKKVFNRSPIIKNVEVKGASFDAEKGAWIVSDAGTYKVSVEVVDYDGNYEENWYVEETNEDEFTLKENEVEKVIKVVAKDNKGESSEKSVKVMLGKSIIEWDKKEALVSGKATFKGDVKLFNEWKEGYTFGAEVDVNGKKASKPYLLLEPVTVVATVSKNKVEFAFRDENGNSIWEDKIDTDLLVARENAINIKLIVYDENGMMVEGDKITSRLSAWYFNRGDVFKNFTLPKQDYAEEKGEEIWWHGNTLRFEAQVATGVAFTNVELTGEGIDADPYSVKEGSVRAITVNETTYYYFDEPATVEFVMNREFGASTEVTIEPELTVKINSEVLQTLDLETIKYDDLEPRFTNPTVECKPREYVKITFEKIEDANGVDATLVVYDLSGNKLGEVAIEKAGDEWVGEFTFDDLKDPMDKTYIKIQPIIVDKFGNESKTIEMIKKDSYGESLYLDTLAVISEKGWEFDNAFDESATYTSAAATGIYDVDSDKSKIKDVDVKVEIDYPGASSEVEYKDGEVSVKFSGIKSVTKKLAEVTLTATDSVGNVKELSKKFWVDPLAATVTDIDGIDPAATEAEQEASVTYKWDTEKVSNDLTFDLSGKEDIYTLKVEIWVAESTWTNESYTKHWDNPILEKEEGQNNFKLNLANDLKLVVDSSPATLHIQIKDYAGNISDTWLVWEKGLTTAKRKLFADWTDPAENKDNAIFNYKPELFKDESPSKDTFEDDISDKVQVKNGKIMLTFYATTTTNGAKIFVKGDETNPWLDGGAANNAEADLHKVTFNGTKIEVQLYNTAGKATDFEEIGRKTHVVVKAANADSGDSLETVATATFKFPDLDPNEFNVEAEIKVINGTPFLYVKFNKDGCEYPEWVEKIATNTDNVVVDIYNKTDDIYVESVTKFSQNETDTLLATLNGVYSGKKEYEVVFKEKAIKFELLGTDGLYETNDSTFERCITPIIIK